MYFLIVSGMSGAGKSRAVATLEDLGYYCVDNLPISLIPGQPFYILPGICPEHL